MINDLSFDVVVIGGGHAGCEASAASARLGINTALFTHKIDTIGEMSCNPAIGGLGKGHLVREIDALDGVMGDVADKSGIQFRLLNRSRGPAVRGPRTQSDRSLYRKFMQEKLLNYCNLSVFSDPVIRFLFKKNTVNGFITQSGREIFCKKLILTTGTFLNGIIHVGEKQTPAGRINEKPSTGLSEQLKKYDFKIGRLKTGTPPRLDSRTINFNKLEEQYADDDPYFFSFLTKKNLNKQVSCRMTYTNTAVHKIISKNLKRSAMYSGNIKGVGPRYCPSIEDKVVKFSGKHRHQIFLEPEGLNDHTIYPNGISTSLPEDVQASFVHSIKGLENAHILKPGYAIEYDYVNPLEIKHSLETKKIKNLFFAGQINGTTGYEEAAAQGLVAGINAAIKLTSRSSFIVDRSEGYIGVLIDDLVTKGTKEPYRMFTSRSEYRLTLRADNADQRLTPLGMQIGCISTKRKMIFKNKLKQLQEGFSLVKKYSISPNKLEKNGIMINHDGKKRSAFDLLSFENVSFNDVNNIWPETKIIKDDIREQIEIETQYAGYLDRQREDIIDFKREEELTLPKNLDYKTIGSLSNEIVEKLTLVRPPTLGAASRISGVTPAAIIALLRYVKKQKNYRAA